MHKISSKNIKVSIEKTWKNYQKYAKKYTKSSSSRQRHTLKKYSVVTITVIPRIFVVNFTRKDHAIFKTFRRICQNGLKIPQNDPQQRRRNLLWFFFVKSPSTRIITIISAIFDEKRVISSQEIAIYKKAIIHKIRQPPPPPPPQKKKNVLLHPFRGVTNVIFSCIASGKSNAMSKSCLKFLKKLFSLLRIGRTYNWQKDRQFGCSSNEVERKVWKPKFLNIAPKATIWDSQYLIVFILKYLMTCTYTPPPADNARQITMLNFVVSSEHVREFNLSKMATGILASSAFQVLVFLIII